MKEINIVIIGGGFAGVNLALKLSENKGVNITLLDKNNYNYFTPLVYQVATDFIDTSSICVPFRTLFEGKQNLSFILGELTKLIPGEKKLITNNETISYDYLVIATGAKSNFFGIKNIEQNALPMKSVDDAVKLRNFLTNQAEKYKQVTDTEERQKMRNIVISGAGPSGVEVAGMLAELRNNKETNLFPELKNEKMNIYLVDSSSSVLSSMSNKSQKYTLKSLKSLDVNVQLNKRVSDFNGDLVKFEDGSTIATKTLIWTAGVTGVLFDGIPNDCYDKHNRIKVDAYQQIKGLKDVYAIGDICFMDADPNYSSGHPQMANVAMQQGEMLAKNLISTIKGKKLEPFNYFNKGTMAIISQNKAVADLPLANKTLTGWVAWMGWITVHLYMLLSHKNQIETFLNWTNSYFNKGYKGGILMRKFLAKLAKINNG